MNTTTETIIQWFDRPKRGKRKPAWRDYSFIPRRGWGIKREFQYLKVHSDIIYRLIERTVVVTEKTIASTYEKVFKAGDPVKVFGAGTVPRYGIIDSEGYDSKGRYRVMFAQSFKNLDMNAPPDIQAIHRDNITTLRKYSRVT